MQLVVGNVRYVDVKQHRLIQGLPSDALHELTRYACEDADLTLRLAPERAIVRRYGVVILSVALMTALRYALHGLLPAVATRR